MTNIAKTNTVLRSTILLSVGWYLLGALAYSAPIMSGRPVEGTIATEGQIDSFEIGLRNGESIDYAILEPGENTRFQPTVRFFSPDGNIVSWRFGEIATGDRFQATVGGIYRAEVSAYNLGIGDKTGSYRLVVVKSPDTQDDPEGRHLRSGDTINQNLKLGDIDVFTLDVEAGATILATVVADQSADFLFRPYINLYAPDGEDVSSATAISTLANTSGRYTVVVRDNATDRAGDYELKVWTEGVSDSESLQIVLDDDGQVCVTWPNSGVLRQSDDLKNWSTIVGASSPYKTEITEGKRFYALFPECTSVKEWEEQNPPTLRYPTFKMPNGLTFPRPERDYQWGDTLYIFDAPFQPGPVDDVAEGSRKCGRVGITCDYGVDLAPDPERGCQLLLPKAWLLFEVDFIHYSQYYSFLADDIDAIFEHEREHVIIMKQKFFDVAKKEIDDYNKSHFSTEDQARIAKGALEARLPILHNNAVLESEMIDTWEEELKCLGAILRANQPQE